MQQTLEESDVGGDFNSPSESQQSLPSIITLPTLLDSARNAEDDRLIYSTETVQSIEVKTEEEIEMYNDSEDENCEEYVIVEDAEKYQIIPNEEDLKIYPNYVYYDPPE